MSRIDKLQREIAGISDPPREQLVAAWLKTYGCAAPKGIKRSLLERSAAWHLQARRLGGLSRAANRALKVERPLADGSAMEPEALSRSSGNVGEQSLSEDSRFELPASQRTAIASITSKPRPGTRYMREWNGRMHIVDVADDGFLFDGKTYRSLSAIARRITGARWSGPRFFGQ